MQLTLKLNSTHVKFNVLKGRGDTLSLLLYIYLKCMHEVQRLISTNTYTKKTSQFDTTVAWTIAVKRDLPH